MEILLRLTSFTRDLSSQSIEQPKKRGHHRPSFLALITFCSSIATLYTLTLSHPAYGEAAIDWSESLPKASTPNNPSDSENGGTPIRNSDTEPPALTIESFSSDSLLFAPSEPSPESETPPPLHSSKNSPEALSHNPPPPKPLSHNKSEQDELESNTNNSEDLNSEESSDSHSPTYESFDGDWNKTRVSHARPHKITSENLNYNADILGRQYEPIWRPIYSQITLVDFNLIDCCVRVFNSSSDEVRLKCNRIGQKVWQAGVIRFTPEEPVISQRKSCYILEKKAVGNAWRYRCTAKSQAKCYDPNLPQNIAFITRFEREQAELASQGDDIILDQKTIDSLDISVDSLLKQLPLKPPAPPPAELLLPEVTLDNSVSSFQSKKR